MSTRARAEAMVAAEALIALLKTHEDAAVGAASGFLCGLPEEVRQRVLTNALNHGGLAAREALQEVFDAIDRFSEVAHQYRAQRAGEGS